MHLTRLTLQNFRNYSLARLTPGQGSVVLIGANGAGKTNVLEALSLFAPGRGLRRAQTRDMGRVDGPGGFAVAARFLDGFGLETDLTVGAEPESDQKQLRLSGAPLKGVELESLLKLIWLTPQQDGLFIGPAGDRRRFFDRLALTFDPSHNTHVNAFEKAMRGRNKLLEAGAQPAFFKAVEQEMAHLAVAVAAGRLVMLRALQAEIDAIGDDTTFPKAEIMVDGSLEEALDTKTAVEVEETYQHTLAQNRARDMAAGRTLDGPHRSDFRVFYKSRNMPAEQCSTGEQKALLMNLVLAHASVVSRRSGGEVPTLLLLDEVAAHFDENRRKALFDRLRDLKVQSWITGTDAQIFAPMEAQLFRVETGKITAL